MRIESVTIENYKSYYKPTMIHLTSGFNCLVGANDAGKSAILESIGLRFTDKPHRSIHSRPNRSGPKDPCSVAVAEFSLSRFELIEAINSVSYFALPHDSDSTPEQRSFIAHSFSENIREVNTFQAWYQSGHFIHARLNDFEPTSRSHLQMSVRWNGDGVELTGSYGSGNSDQQFAPAIGAYLQSRIFQFRAERLNAGRSSFGADRTLKGDASNLPEILNTMQGNPHRFRRLNQYIQLIFPHVEHVSVVATEGGGSLEVAVWPYGVGEREDLAVSLSESGTGISQVLAMLTVVLSAEHPQTIIIDEPQSFLHPGAARKLIAVLREYPHHQFILATHSPTIIAAAEPNSITLVQKQGQVSRLHPISKGARDELEYLLHDIGASLSDVFGADKILWVEGKTEELCFPLIARQLIKMTLMGTVILGVSSTGELEGRHAKLVFDIYRRLSGSAGLLPPAIGFILDREMRTKQEQKDLARRSGAPVHFLSRRSYENYLVHPPAIAEVLSADLQDAISTASVSAWLEKHRWMPQWWKETPASPQTEETWLIEVDAPHLLARMFEELSGQKVEYQKTKHSVEITRWLLQNDPKQLAEIQDLLGEVLRSRA